MTKNMDADIPRMRAAVAELQERIRSRYPTATFAVGGGWDDPDGVYITATVDLDDPDEVIDLIVERLLELQIDEGLPVYVIPTRTPERVAAMLEERRAQERASA
jgi:hypothetical protein